MIVLPDWCGQQLFSVAAAAMSSAAVLCVFDIVDVAGSMLMLSANLRSALDLMGAVMLIFPGWFSMMRRSLQGRCLMCSR